MSLNESVQRLQDNLDIEGIIALWRETKEGWEPVADGMLAMTAELIQAANLAAAARLLGELANTLVGTDNPVRSREYGVPSYPNQAFIAQGARLRMGIPEAREKLTKFEANLAGIADGATRSKYLAWLGWSYGVGGDAELGRKKFPEAIDVATRIASPSHSCAALVEIARIAALAGHTADATASLDAAARAASAMADQPVYSGATGAAASAASWAADLHRHVANARADVASTSANKAGPPFGWILDERNLRELDAELSARSFGAAVERARASLQTGHPFDTCLILSSCALACHLARSETTAGS